MKRLLITAAAVTAAAAMTLMTGAAFAATDNGTIKLIDSSNDAITLSDGKTFTLGEGTEAESLQIGQKVIVTYASEAGNLVASKIVVAK